MDTPIVLPTHWTRSEVEIARDVLKEFKEEEQKRDISLSDHAWEKLDKLEEFLERMLNKK